MFKYILIIVIVLLFPIPIFIKVNNFSGVTNYYLFSYRINKEIFKKNKNTEKETSIKNTLSIIKNLSNLKLKLHLYFKFDIKISSEDAFNTAMLFGFFNALSSLVSPCLSNFFKLKKFVWNTYIDFDNNKIIFQIKSIFLVNLVKLTYIALLMLKLKKATNSELKNYST